MKCPDPSRTTRARGSVKAGLSVISLDYQANVLASQVNRLVVAPGVFVMQHLDDPGISSGPIGSSSPGRSSVRLPTSEARREQQSNDRRSEGTCPQSCSGSGRGSHSGMSNTNPSSNIPRAWSNATVPLRRASAVKLAIGKPVSIVPQTRRGKMHGLFEVPALRLKMMRGQIHAFRPNDLGQQLHAESPASIGAGHSLANGFI